jgi:hypothetical protein
MNRATCDYFLPDAVNMQARFSGRLNPRFVEQMMGYPVDWTALTDSECLAIRLSRK